MHGLSLQRRSAHLKRCSKSEVCFCLIEKSIQHFLQQVLHLYFLSVWAKQLSITKNLSSSCLHGLWNQEVTAKHNRIDAVICSVWWDCHAEKTFWVNEELQDLSEHFNFWTVSVLLYICVDRNIFLFLYWLKLVNSSVRMCVCDVESAEGSRRIDNRSFIQNKHQEQTNSRLSRQLDLNTNATDEERRRRRRCRWR